MLAVSFFIPLCACAREDFPTGSYPFGMLRASAGAKEGRVDFSRDENAPCVSVFASPSGKVETVCLRRAARCRITYPPSSGKVLSVGETHAGEGVSCRGFRGERRMTGRVRGKESDLFYTIDFDSPFSACGENASLSFASPGPVEFKIAVSAVSVEGAVSNLVSECGNFDAFAAGARAAWKKALGTITIEADGATKSSFYQALAECFSKAVLVSDYPSKEERYAPCAPSRSFRTLYPLYTVVAPDKVPSLVRSLADDLKKDGKLSFRDRLCAVPVLTDAFLKSSSAPVADAEGEIDWQEVYGIVRECVLAAKEPPSVESAYSAACAARFAAMTGKGGDVAAFVKRAYGPRKDFNWDFSSPLASSAPGDASSEDKVAWRVFSVLGFYPADPCSGWYSFKAPLAESAVVSLPGGKTFRVRKTGTATEGCTVESGSRVASGGKIRHESLMRGGTAVIGTGKK